MFKPTKGLVDIHYDQHEFEVFGKKFITISAGDVFILESLTETYRVKVVGYGYDRERSVLKMFVTLDNNDELFAIDMLVLTGVLQLDGTQITIIGDATRFFQIRHPKEVDIKITKKLARYLDTMQGITVKHWGNGTGNPNYFFTEDEIGYPDWHIVFRATTNYGGVVSLAKIATLTSAFPGQVFIMAKNYRKPEEYKQAHANATLFFSILAVDVPPSLCLQTLKNIDKKFVE